MDKSSINSKNFQQIKSILDDDFDNKSMKIPSKNNTNETQHNTENDFSDNFLPNSNFLSNCSKQERTNDFMKSSANLISSRYSKQIVSEDKMNFRFEKDRNQDENEDELLLGTTRKLNRNESSFDSIGLKKKINLDLKNRSSDQEYSEIANDDEDEEEVDDEEDQVLFTGYVPIALRYFTQQSKPRYWCLKMITSPWFERISMLIIIINCITLGMYQPCNDNPCTSTRCRILTQIDNLIFIFFAVEMVIKILAMGFYGKDTYLADSWNRLDFFIVLAGTFEYAVVSENLSLSAIRTVRVLRPLRAINRVPSMRILVMLLLDTLPMLGNVLLLCFFVFFIFGIIGVQLWKGVLRNRCFFDYNHTLMSDFLDESFKNTYYKPDHDESFICGQGAGGMTTCSDIPPFINNTRICNSTIDILRMTSNKSSHACINWNHYYSICRPSDKNPFQGAISFDNIGYAWVSIFQIISLESWVTIMYYIQDAHSFWNWIYFVFLIVIGSFFMINLCLVVIATQFSETKKRETERMIAERRRFSRSSSTLLSDSGGEPGTCWEEFLKYTGHLFRKTKRRILRKYNQYKINRKRSLNEKILKLNKKSTTKDDLNRIFIKNNSDLNQVNLNCKCKCHLVNKNYHQPDIEPYKQIDENSFNLNNEVNLFYHSGQNFNSNQNLDENCNINSYANMITDKPESPNAEKCSICKHSKKFDIIHKKMLNLNDSAILSFSINSNNSKALNRNASNEVKYFKENCSNLLMDNQEYFYCYSTILNPHLGKDSNIGDSECLKENHESSKNKQVDETTRKSRNKLRKAKQTRNQNCFLSCFCCCPSRLVNTKVCIFLNMINRNIKNFVDGNFFQRTILFSILINTFCMGIEHHQQPNSLTLIVEYSNIFFTIVFLIEMLLKIISNSPYGYIKNAFNLLDGIIVGISCYEVFKQLLASDSGVQISSSGVSVLRTFRLLRILKLVRFMPALRRQLLVMLRTIDNVATFFSLLVLFIFIFSILGMNLFGCKFCEFEPNGTRVCERKNFDSLLWATITVFQVLTQEDWNEVLYNGMEKTSSWAALYFIVLMTFGNYVLFNLLVAILVEGFSSEDEPKKAIEDRIIEDAMHAIAEEASRETHSAQSLSRKNSKKKSRKNSKISITEDENFTNQSCHHSHNLTKQKSLGISINDETKQIQKNLSVRENLNLNLNNAKKSNQLPIITQTCPTPTYTPSSSSQNSPLPIRFNFKPSIKSRRKFSLDSSSHRIKLEKLNKQNYLTNSTNSKIFDDKELSLKSARSDIAHLGQTKIESILKKSRLEKKNSSPKKIDFQFTDNKSNLLKSRNKGASKLIISAPKIILDLSNENDSIITNNSIQNENIHTTSNFNRITRKRLSKSFHENLYVNSSNLTIPKAVYKRPRSKSERIKTKTNKISDKNEPFNKDIVPCDQMVNNQESSIVINIKNHKPVFIRKSDLFNIDINLSRSRSDIQLDSNLNETKKKARLDFGIISKISKSTEFLKDKEEYSLYIFSPQSFFRNLCTIFIQKKCFDYTILFFIALNCITLAMERPNIPQNSIERKFLNNSNYCFTIIFALEMIIKVISTGLFVGKSAYFKSGWNKMDGILVVISLIDIVVTFTAKSSPKIFGILRVFRLLRTLRPLRVISRAPGLKLVVQTLLSSLRPIGNIVLICCTFFIIFGILGVQLFKGKLYHCEGPNISNVKDKIDCLANPNNEWVNSQYNFDNLGQALMTLFVLSSKDGWVEIMYSGIDAVAVDKQPIENYNEWMLLYFISFLLLVGFFVLNMFVGVIIENFHKCRAQQEREEKARRAAKRAKKFEIKRKKMKEIPYYANYSKIRRYLHDICNNKYFDLVIAGVIGLNVVSMSLEFYMMPKVLEEILDILNILFTLIFLLEAILRLVALGFYRYFREKWNQLDVLIVILSIVGIVFDKLNAKSAIPINPTIIRVMRVLRIARVLKLLKMAKGIRSLLDTVIQALPQVGNLGLLFFLLFFIFAILGVELFGKLNCEDERSECDGLSKHAHFHNFGMAFLTLFRIATGDNWNGIMKDTLKDNILCRDESTNQPSSSMCLSSILAPIYFVIFVLMAQFVLVNVVVAVLMKHLDDSNKMMADDAEMDEEIEQQLEDEARNNIFNERDIKMEDDLDDLNYYRISKQNSLPPNFIFNLKTDNKNNLFLHSNEKKIDQLRKSLEASSVVNCGSDKGCSIEEETESIKLVIPSIKLKNLRNKIGQNDKELNSSSINLSMTNESDSNSDFIRLRKKNKVKKIFDDEVKSHFSPRSSVKIRVIDETDTDNNEIY